MHELMFQAGVKGMVIAITNSMAYRLHWQARRRGQVAILYSYLPSSSCLPMESISH